MTHTKYTYLGIDELITEGLTRLAGGQYSDPDFVLELLERLRIAADAKDKVADVETLRMAGL